MMRAESTELLTFGTSLLQDDPGLYRKALRVKSLKTYEWLVAEASVYHLFITCLVVAAPERCMFKFMLWQETDQCFVVDGTTPMIQMANMDSSPSACAVRHLAHILTDGVIGEYRVQYEEFAQGHVHTLVRV